MLPKGLHELDLSIMTSVHVHVILDWESAAQAKQPITQSVCHLRYTANIHNKSKDKHYQHRVRLSSLISYYTPQHVHNICGLQVATLKLSNFMRCPSCNILLLCTTLLPTSTVASVDKETWYTDVLDVRTRPRGRLLHIDCRVSTIHHSNNLLGSQSYLLQISIWI